MYEEFLKNSTSNRNHHFDQLAFDSIVNSEIKTLFTACGGTVFQNGLYKIHNPESSLSWANLIGQYFTEFKNRIIPFGYDWLGRQYAVDNARGNVLLMFDPSTAENFCIKPKPNILP